MKVKPRGKIYSLNEGYAEAWSEGLKSYIAEKKSTAVSIRLHIAEIRFGISIIL